MGECIKQRQTQRRRRLEQIYKWQLQNWWAAILFSYPAVPLSLLAQLMPRCFASPLPCLTNFTFVRPQKQNQFPVTYSACFSSAQLGLARLCFYCCVCVSCVKNWIEFIFLFLSFSTPLLALPTVRLLFSFAARQIDDSGLFCQRVLFISLSAPAELS